MFRSQKNDHQNRWLFFSASIAKPRQVVVKEFWGKLNFLVKIWLTWPIPYFETHRDPLIPQKKKNGKDEVYWPNKLFLIMSNVYWVCCRRFKVSFLAKCGWLCGQAHYNTMAQCDEFVMVVSGIVTCLETLFSFVIIFISIRKKTSTYRSHKLVCWV